MPANAMYFLFGMHWWYSFRRNDACAAHMGSLKQSTPEAALGQRYRPLVSPGLAILSVVGSNFVFSVASNGYAGHAVEGADCALLPGGAWGWTVITNYSVNPGGSISVPLDGGARKIIRLKQNP